MSDEDAAAAEAAADTAKTVEHKADEVVASTKRKAKS
jgi:hypothetical protein